MSEEIERLNDFVAVLRDGILFYRDAQRQLDDDLELHSLFARMIAVRERLVLELTPFVWNEDEYLRYRGTFIGELRKGLTYVKSLAAGTSSTYLAALAEQEQRTVSELRACIQDVHDPRIDTVLSANLQTFEDTASTMHRLSSR